MASMDELYKERMAKFLRAFYLAKYTKNDNMPCEIEPGLFLGSVGAAYNKAILKSLNITHILLVANALEPAYPNDFKYKQVEALELVRSKRPQVAPNQGFLLQLQSFENRLGVSQGTVK